MTQCRYKAIINGIKTYTTTMNKICVNRIIDISEYKPKLNKLNPVCIYAYFDPKNDGFMYITNELIVTWLFK